MGWIVYSKDGQTERCVLHKLEYSGTFMVDRSVIATFSSEKKIDFNVFDYITYRGERFELELLPTVKKVSSREYKYELRFVSLKYELERCMMRNIVPGDNGIVYPTPLTVEFTGDVKYLAERIQACLDAMYGKGTWSITIAEGTESEEKNISMSNQNCWNALSIVNTEYKLNYFIKGRNVIIGGEEPVVDNVFEYGKGKGLYEIERISDTDTGVVTKLRAYGGTRNLDYSYPKLPEWKDSVLPTNYALSPLRLMLPSFKTDGKTDYVLASEEAIAKYGIREGVITYDDIYPSITGMKNSEGQAIDEIKSVSTITSDTQPTFTVGLYDLGFDLSDSLTTDEAQLSMKSGSLQGYAFNITKIEVDSDGGYILTLGRNTLEEGDTGNFTVPNKDWNMKAGDKFVLLNILMPQEYIRDAENRLLARAKEYLAKYSTTNYSYNVGVDEIFMARNVNFYNDIMEGKRLTVNDQEIGINNENIIIQSLTIKEGEGIIPTFEVTLNNETTASTLDRIQGQISEVEISVNNNFSSQSELLKQYRKKLDKSVWDSIFVIHKNDPENPERITSVQSLVGLWTNEFLSSKGLNPGSGGGSGEGGATALYQLNDVAKNASETGVLGAGPGKVLTYGTDGKWYAADAIGLDETALGKYLTDNNYAKKSDIPSLSGYATESWVLGKNYITSSALSDYATQEWVNNQGYATASSLKVVSDKLNDFLTGTDTDGIINKWKELESFLAGQTQTSTLAELLAVKADKATTLSGYGITDAYTKSEINSKLNSYVTTTALNTALAKKVDVAFLGKVFGFIGDNNSEVSINDTEAVITSIKAKFGLWTDEYLSSKGLNPNAGGGSGEGATALYQLNDVAQNANGTGVLGAEVGKVLTYGSDGKWYAAKAGMDEDTLSNYLTVNNYAQKSDIPSLDGYATQSWVNTALGNKVDKVSGMGLSQNNFTDALLQKLNGIAEGANKYILPVAKAAVLGGVMIGSTLDASATGVLDLPEVMTAGTYAKVTTDIYGRVTGGSSLSAGDIPALSIYKITGLQDALDKKVSKSDFATEFDKAMQRWFVRDTANKGLHPADYDSEAVGIYSDSYVSSKGVNTGTGGGTGGASSLGELNNVGSWADEIPTVDRIMVQRKGATHWESLNLSDIGLNKSQLADYLIANNYAKKSDIPSLSGYATQAWVTTQLGDYTTTTDLTALLGNKVDKVEGKGLSSNDFTDTLLNKLNGIEAGANKYVLPTASSSVLGGVKVGSTLAIANGVLNLKSGIATAGTYTKVTVDTYGRVTAGTTLVASDIPTLAISKISGLQTALDGKADTDGSNATGTWGISITGSSRRLYQAPLTNEDLNDLTYANHSGKMYYAGGSNTTVNFPSDTYGLMVWRIAAGYTGQIGFGSNNNLYKRRIDNNGVATGWMRIVDESNFSTILDTRYVTKTFLARLFGAMDADGNEIAVNNTSTVIDSIKAKVGLWTEQYLSSLGFNPNAGSGGGGSDYDRLDAWGDYDASKSGYVLSAGLGWDLNTRVESLESKSITLTTTGTGNGLASFTQTGNSVVFTKANFLTSHQTIYGLTLQKNGTSLGTYTPNSAAKTINITVPTKVSELSNDSGFALKSYVDGNFPKLTDGLIPSSYLPSYVDDVIEAANLASFPKTGESGKIYVALDTNLTYRWSGTTYVEISPSLALGETSNTAYAGDKGKANATAIAALKAITISAGTGLSGGGNLTANRTISLKVATTEALGGIKVGNRLSIDANGVLSATYTYTLPTASATVLGGVKVGTTLAIASGVLNLKAVGTAGTYFKVTTDAYGRVTAGSNPTTLAGFGITDGVNAVTVSGSGNAVTSASISGHKITLTKGTTFLTKAAFDDLFEKVNIGTSAAPVYAIKAKYGLYTEQFLSSMGLAQGSGGGGGSDLDVYGSSDLGGTFDDKNLGNTFNAYTVNNINTRVVSLEGGAAVTVTTSGTGTVVTGVTKAGTVITVTKGNLAFGSITGKPTTLAGYGITDAYTKTQADGAYVKKSGSAMTGGIDWTAAGKGLYAIKLGVSHYISIDGTDNSSMLHWTGTGTILGSTKGTTTIRSNASNLSHNYNGTEYVILDARNYNSYAPTKTGTGASGTWEIDVTGYSKRLIFNQTAAVANTLMTGAGLYYNQVSSSTDTGYPSDYGHVIRLQRGVGTTLTSSQSVLDLFHQTGATGLNQLYLRTGYGDGSKMVWGSFVQLLHTGNYTSLITKIGTSTVGGTAKGIYLNGGTPTAMSATVGSTTLPVYMSGGTITACSTTLGVSVTGYSGRLLEAVLTKEDLNTYTYSSYSGRTFYGSGGNTVTNKPSGLDSFGLLVLRSAGGYTTQLAYSGSDLYARYYNGTTWYAWTEFAHITDNVASATKLQTARTIFGKSFNGTANVAGQALVYGTYTATASSRYSNGGLQIRENGMVGSAQTDDGYAPAIGFHWANRKGASLIYTASGFKFLNQAFTGYETVYANFNGTLTGNASSASTAAKLTTARTITIAGQALSFDGTANLTYSRNSMSVAYGKEATYSTTTTADGWYRIAASSVGINNANGIFTIHAGAPGYHTVATINASTSYGRTPDITQLGCSNYINSQIKAVRLVYHTTYSGNYAYLEIQTIAAISTTIEVRLIGGEGWNVYGSVMAGSIPSGYSARTLTLANNSIKASNFRGTYVYADSVIGNSSLSIVSTGANNISFRYNNTDATALVFNGTAFKPYDAATGAITNGTASGRWGNMYSVSGNFSGRITAGGITVGYNNTNYSLSTSSFICNSWIRTAGNVGWFNETHAGGIYMTDTTWVRIYNGKKFYVSNTEKDGIYVAKSIRIGNYYITSTDNGLSVTSAVSGKVGGLYADGFISSLGLNPGTGGGGGGSDYDRLDNWSDYTADKAGYVLSAKLGNDLNTRVKSLEGGSALTVTTTGSGNAVTAVTKSGTTITVTKGTTFLTSHQSLANYVTLNSAQTITATKTWTASQRMGNASIYRVNNTTGANATGSHWFTDTTYATIQFGIGVYTDKNVSPRAYIGWGTNPWTVSSNLTVSSTQLTYKSNSILHSANYNDFVPSKTGTGASGTWAISVTGNAVTATRLTVDGASKTWTTLADKTGNSIVGYTDTSTTGRWFDYGSVFQFSNQNNPDPGVSGHWLTQLLSSTSNLLGVRWRTNTGAWTAVQTLVTSTNYTTYTVTKTGSGASGTWGISITGNAATASTSTKLTTARTIWGQSFNGTANVSGALSSATTISATGIISTTAPDPGFRVLSGSTNKTAVGYRSADAGAYIYSYVSAKYMGVHDDGYPVFGAGNGCLMMPYTVKLFTKSNYEYWVVLLWETTTQTTHRLTGKIYTNTTGSSRYQAADVALWYSKWSTGSDSSFLFNTYGQNTPWNLVTCTYGGKTYYALQHINTQAVTAYFMGTNSKIAFTAVKYYTMAHGDVAAVVNDSEINGSIADVTTSVMSANGTPYALTSSNVASATKLATARTLWGQSFNGTANVSGALTGVTTITASTGVLTLASATNNIYLKRGAGDAASIVLNDTQFKPFDTANGKLALGWTSARWNGVYSTSGNFTGYVYSSGWFENTAAEKGLYNSAGDARWYYAASVGGWRSDKPIASTSTVQGTQLKSTVATGTAPLTVASTTKVTNLNADLLDGYHLSSTYAVNTVVMRNNNGYIYAGYINSNTAVNENSNISQIITTTSSDGFFRKSSLDQLRSSILNIKKTLDLTALDANKWYPCTVTLSKNILYTIQIWNSLNGDKPAWATHANGFTLNLMWQVSGDEWNAGDVQRKILNSYYSFAPSNPCGGIEQNVMASVEIVYLRGGAKYYYLIDNGNAFAINSSGYSWKSGDYSYSAPVLTAVKADPVRCYSNSVLGIAKLYAPFIGSSVNFNNRISVTTDGKLTPYSTSTRRSGVYGVYDAAKIGHIWSMGTGYMIADDGSNFGNLYGFAYKYITNTTGGTMASGHQAVWCENGAPRVALGTNLWVANNAIVGDNLSVSGTASAATMTIKNTGVNAHLIFSRGSFNYITAPASGSIAFIAGGQAVGEATCELIINSGYLYAGTTNATSLGKSDRRWSNTYTQLLNVAGAATLSSTLAVTSTITGSGAINGSRLGISNISNTTGYGLSLYNGAVSGMPTYGIAFAGTGTFGTHGGVSGDWATYFTMSDTTTRGWIFRRGSTCVASISGAGTAAFSGGLTVAGTANLNGVLNANNTTDATSTTAAGAVFDGGVGIVKQLRVGGVVTLSSSLVVPYTTGQWISLATRTNIIYGSQSQSESSAHGLFRVKTFGGNAVTFGGLKNETGFYGFTKAIIDAGTNNYSWRTIWDTATGNISTTGAISTSGSLNATGAINANSTTDSTSTTTGSIICDGGLGVAKQLRVGTTSTFTGKTTHNGGFASTTGTFSSTLSVTGVFTASTTVNIAGVLNANNITDATSTTAASLVCDGGVGVVKQLRVGGTLSIYKSAEAVNLVSGASDQKITKTVSSSFFSGINFYGTLGSNMGHTDIQMNIYSGGAIQIHSQGGSGTIILNGIVHNNTGMYSDGYMSSKGLNDTSDMRLKNKVRDIFLPVKDIANAPAFEYTWKDGTPGAMVGSSAQYWQKVLPPSVKKNKDGYLSLFSGHTALVAAISVAREVETLEKRVARLEKENKEKDKTIKDLNQKYITLKNMYYGKSDSAC